MTLIDDWKKVWLKLWSVRLALFAALASAIETAWQVYVTGQPPIFAIVSLLVSLGAAAARIVCQPGVLNAD